SECTGWPSPMSGKLTPQTREDFTPNLPASLPLAGWACPKVQSGEYQYSNGDHEKIVLNLEGQSQLAGWSTPASWDCQGTHGGGQGRSLRTDVTQAATLAGWPTASCRDHKDGSAESCANVADNALLGRVALKAGWQSPKL